LRQVRKKCASLGNVTIEAANILQLPYPEDSFDKVIAGNVIHLLDDPLAALGELDRVCKPGGAIIVPTYINKNAKGDDGAFSKAVGKAGADFKRQFYLRFVSSFLRGCWVPQRLVHLHFGARALCPCGYAEAVGGSAGLRFAMRRWGGLRRLYVVG